MSFGTGVWRESRDRYFAIFEDLRANLGYADYLGALQRYRLQDLCDPRLLMMSSYLVDYPFANRLYPGSLDALVYVRQWGLTVILSDGDVVFQPPCFYDGPGLLAAIHVTAALGTADAMIEWRYFDLEAQLYDSVLTPVSGQISVPQRPGLGLDPDRNVICDYLRVGTDTRAQKVAL